MFFKLYFVLFLLLLSTNIFAYIDPGSGNIILQVILGGVGGIILFWKIIWDKIKSLFKKNDDNADSEISKKEEPEDKKKCG